MAEQPTDCCTDKGESRPTDCCTDKGESLTEEEKKAIYAALKGFDTKKLYLALEILQKRIDCSVAPSEKKSVVEALETIGKALGQKVEVEKDMASRIGISPPSKSPK